MSTKDKRVLIVDDSAPDIQFLMANLKDDYAILAATSGSKALEMAEKEPYPDVILMDVEMPEMNGYETCRRLKENPLTQDIPVIFVSAHDTVEEKMAGYEAGGVDYVIKPIQPSELIQKVAVSIRNKELQKELAAEKDNILSGFMEVLTSSGEQGVVIEFLRNSFSVNNAETLAELIIEAVAKYSLNATVQIRVRDGAVHAASSEPIPPLEQELLSRLRDQGRIMEHGQRLILNYGVVSLLIKNLPQDDLARGRLRDHLALLAEGAESKMASLEMARQEQERKHGLLSLVSESMSELKDIQEWQEQHKAKSMDIMDEMLQELEQSFLAWGLTEEQEQTLINVVERGINHAWEHHDIGSRMDARFEEVIKRFAELAE